MSKKGIAQIVMAFLLCLLSNPSRAVRLGAGIVPNDTSADPLDGTAFIVDHFLKPEKSTNGKQSYTIDFEENVAGHDNNRRFVSVLKLAIDLNAQNRHQIADAIAEFGDTCNLDALSIKMFLAPIPGLVTLGVSDYRHIARLAVFDCIANGSQTHEPLPPGKECAYHSYDNNDSGYTLNGLIHQLSDCHNRYQLMRDTERQYQFDPCADVVLYISTLPGEDEYAVGKLIKRIDTYGGANCTAGRGLETPLMAAVRTGNGSFIDLLLQKYNASVNNLDGQHRTALDYANDLCTSIQSGPDFPSLSTSKEWLLKSCRESVDKISGAGGKIGTNIE